MITSFYGILVILWILNFVSLFTDVEQSKFTVGCAYLIVIIVSLQYFIEGLIG